MADADEALDLTELLAPDVLAYAEPTIAGRFEAKTVIVTGAASGIGRATASRVAREGGRVVAVDLAAEGLADLHEELAGFDVVPVTADLTDDGGIDAIVDAAGASIAGLANVAGTMDTFQPIHEVTDAVWDRVFAINVVGLVRLTRAVVPSMLAAGRGSVVNIASEASLRGSAAGVAYTASKHAVVGITTSSAYMYMGSGVRFNAVAPGPTLTGMRPTFESELGTERVMAAQVMSPKLATPPALAASITFLLSDDAVNLNGAVLPSDGGWSTA